jgi:hypothetical protein
MSTHIQIIRNEVTNIRINDTTAVLAWRDHRDEAAVHWLREKYYPLLAELAVQLFERRELVERVVHTAFERGLEVVEQDEVLPPLMTLFTGMAFRVCADIQCEWLAVAA